MNSSALVVLSLTLFSSPARAGIVYLYDTDLSFRINGVNLAAGDYEARWGRITPGNLATPDVFSVFFGNAPTPANDGVFTTHGAGQNELIAVLDQSDNSLVPFGTQLGLALTTLPDDSDFGASNLANTVVLFDPGWFAPAFTLVGPDLEYSFTANTRAAYRNGQTVLIDYRHNGGADVINLITIPEPSAAAILAGLGALGFAAARRRRHQAHNAAPA